MTCILLIDDDSQLVALLSEYLTRDGFSVASARDGAAGAAEALSVTPNPPAQTVRGPSTSATEAPTTLFSAIRAGTRSRSQATTGA